MIFSSPSIDKMWLIWRRCPITLTLQWLLQLKAAADYWPASVIGGSEWLLCSYDLWYVFSSVVSIVMNASHWRFSVRRLWWKHCMMLVQLVQKHVLWIEDSFVMRICQYMALQNRKPIIQNMQSETDSGKYKTVAIFLVSFLVKPNQ